MRKLWHIQNFGVTDLLPGRIRFGWENDFFIFAPQKHFSCNNEDGAQIWGFWQEEFDQSFYIYNIHEVLEGGDVENGSYYWFGPRTNEGRPEDLKEYREIDEGWIEEKRGGAFVQKADDGLNATLKAGGTQSLYMEKIGFYQNPADIFQHTKIAKLHGTESCWSDEVANRRAERIIFDGFSRSSGLPLKAFMTARAKQPHALVFVNFIDKEQNVLCDAHAQLISLLTFYMKEDYPRLNITIIDVMVRDEKGTTPYTKDFQDYYNTNRLGKTEAVPTDALAPFVMVLGCPDEITLPNITDLKTDEGVHRFDFDLFHGGDEAFEINVRRALYGVTRLAGAVTDNVTVYLRDLRGLTEEKAMEERWEMEDNSLVVKFHTKKYGVFQCVFGAVSHLKLTGRPYVSMVLADGPKDIVEIHDDTDIFSELSGVSDWTPDRAGSLAATLAEIYDRHKLNGAAPLPVNPAKPKESVAIK